MNKGEQFMLMVQTGLILHYVKRDHDQACAVWAIDHLAEAASVIPRIPQNVAPSDAAHHFLRWALRPKDYEPSECPSWLVEGSE